MAIYHQSNFFRSASLVYFHWHHSHPPASIWPAIIKEGAGSEARMPFTHLGNVLPIYVLFAAYLKHFKSNQQVAEIGCGTGRLLYFLASRLKILPRITGLDYSHDAIQYAQKFYRHPQLKFLSYHGSKIPLASNSLDAVLSSHVLEHIPPSHAGHYLRELYRILKPKAYLMLGTPNRALLQDLFKPNPTDNQLFRFVLPHEHEYYGSELEKLIKSHQFKNIHLGGIKNLPTRRLHRHLAKRLKADTLIKSFRFFLIHILRSFGPLWLIDYLGKLTTEQIMNQLNLTYSQLATGWIYIPKIKSKTAVDNFFVIAQKP